jgi:aryl-alcohol dehydrogenase-like predicted oxidoreductase
METGVEKRRLGKTSIEISRIGLGCATFGREIDEATAFRIMDYAIENGINFFDTAEIYGGGQSREYRCKYLGVDDVREVSNEYHSSERIIGRWLKARRCRKEIVLESKVQTNFTRAHIAEALDASLERLQTDRIDSYLFHSFDSTNPLEEGLEAMTIAVKNGKIRVAGCSNFTSEQLTSALDLSERHGWTRMEITQPHYNLVTREAEKSLLPLCRKQQVATVGYSPLGAGFLSGKYTPNRNAFPKGSRFDVVPAFADLYFFDEKFQVVERLKDFATRVGVPMVRLALGWVLRNTDLTMALVGARTTAHIDNALLADEMDFPGEWMAQMSSWEAKS